MFFVVIYGTVIGINTKNRRIRNFMISSYGRDTMLLNKTTNFQIGVVSPESHLVKPDSGQDYSIAVKGLFCSNLNKSVGKNGRNTSNSILLLC